MTALCISIGPDWPLAKAEFDRIGIEVDKFQAIVEDNRVLAFNKSVHAALLLMPEGGWLFEDDVSFTDTLDPVKAAISKLPSDFNSLSLGSNIIGVTGMVWQMPEYYTEGVAKVWNQWMTHANYYSKQTVEFILSNFPFVTDEYKTEGCMIFDEWFRLNVLTQGKSFLLNPMIAYQRPRHSEIWNVASDYTGAHTQGNEWLKQNLI